MGYAVVFRLSSQGMNLIVFPHFKIRQVAHRHGGAEEDIIIPYFSLNMAKWLKEERYALTSLASPSDSVCWAISRACATV